MTPKTLVTSFIEDYFWWNERSNALKDQIQEPHDADLLALGIIEPVRPDQITDLQRYVEIKRRHSEGFTELLGQVQADWQRLVEKYCRPNTARNSSFGSFGSPPSHHPREEIIVSVKIDDKESVVKTQNTRDYGHGTLVSDYEYHLSYWMGGGI